MQIPSSILLFALGASAAVTPHRRHQQLHEKRAVGDLVIATIDGQVVSWTNVYDGATATAQATGATPATATATATADSTYSSAGNSKSASTYTAFCAASKTKRTTEAEIAYEGNVGSTWGCNIILVDSSIADQYDHTMTFTSGNGEEQACVCWNKIGRDGLITGAFGDPAVSFSVPAGTEQTVAIDSNSQGACACAPGDVPADEWGQWAATWIEFDMANTSNDKYSGGDVSAIVPQTDGLTVQGMSVCTEDGTQCSRLGPGASDVHEAYIESNKDVGGIGIKLSPGQVRFNVIAGYTG